MLLFFLFTLAYSVYKFKFILTKNDIVFLIILLASIIFSDKYPVIIPIGTEVSELSVSTAITFTVAFLFNPTLTIIVVVLGTIISDIITKKKWYKILFNTANIGTATGITSLFFSKFYNPILPFTSPQNLGVVIFGAATHFFLESFFLYLLLSFIVNRPLFSFYVENIKFIAVEVLTLYPLGIVLMYFFKYNPLMNAFLLPSLIAVYYALQRRYVIIQETKNALFAIAEVVDKKIPDTIDHTKRVAIITEAICNELQLPLSQTNEIVLAAMLHDIGKIVIPDFILKKSDPNDDEMEVIHLHVIEGEKIVSRLSLFRKGAVIIRHHHEKWDGTGYPDHLKGEEIPLGSRIIAIADSFDAMTTQRYYRDRVKSFDEGLKELKACAGTQFDPNLVEIAIKVISQKREELLKLMYPILQSQ
ncbi:HD-GYP domain-containing protein [Caldisericum exile]|uniref:HD-GYP domain-containing protein n=1 Tax=Caldisericum exile TaxID=693075 RepID=UPI0012EAB917|nr:HD domain-containing phosphohydrolase [Caldisericum exile]